VEVSPEAYLDSWVDNSKTEKEKRNGKTSRGTGLVQKNPGKKNLIPRIKMMIHKKIKRRG